MVKTLKEPHPLAGRKLTTGSCPECKRVVEIKANINGIAYYYCAWPDIETGERCNHQGRFSPKMSAKLCTAYLNGSPVLSGAAMQSPPPHLKENNEPANKNHAPLESQPSNGGREPERPPEREPEPIPEPIPEPEPEPIRNCFGF